ncbi:ABC transporter transmembrane domain-containing protein [Synechococcus sp. AH-229-G18]|nr:ABC transporter transmembrane domain-containing protein [Synechococcus sp. AH-229-G18]
MTSSYVPDPTNKLKNWYYRFFEFELVKSIVKFDWDEVRYKQIIITSILINLLELAAPLYINIVYTVIIPTKAYESLLILSGVVILMIIASGILKSVRLFILGQDSARFEHTKRLSLIRHFLLIPVSKFLETSPSSSFARLNSINLLRDEGALQFVSTSIDIVFSIIFILVLMFLGGPFLVLPVIGAIIYYIREGYVRLDYYKSLNRERNLLEIKNMNYQANIIESVETIKSNGLSRNFISEEEVLRENISSHKVIENINLSYFKSYGRLVNQSTYALVITIGAILIINDRMLIGSLTACILLVGKIIGPWQQAIDFLRSYIRLDFARDEYDEIMNTSINFDVSGHNSFNQIFNSELMTIKPAKDNEIDLKINQSSLIRDNSQGQKVREIFMNLMQIENNSEIKINNISTSDFIIGEVFSGVSYVNPAHQFFEGSILQNISSFQQSKYKKSALFWTFYLSLDEKIKMLPKGYETAIGGTKNSGLSRDDILLLHIIRGLARKPKLLCIDLIDCSFGKSFVDGLEIILNRCNNKSTVLLCGSGSILAKLSTNLVTIQ